MPRAALLALGRRCRGAAAGLVAPAHAALGPGTLADPERDDLVAFAELLVEGRPLPPAERDALLQSIAERIAREPDYLALCRTTVDLLRRIAGRRFSSLSVAERAELMARHRLDAPDAPPQGDPRRLADAARAVRTRARRALIADYYNSPAGWAAVGYDTFPGRCSDLARYTRPEA